MRNIINLGLLNVPYPNIEVRCVEHNNQKKPVVSILDKDLVTESLESSFQINFAWGARKFHGKTWSECQEDIIAMALRDFNRACRERRYYWNGTRWDVELN